VTADSILQEIDIVSNENKSNIEDTEGNVPVLGKASKQRVFCDACLCSVSNMTKHEMTKKHQRCVELSKALDKELDDLFDHPEV
jgi:uncharacterized protein YqfB (UPF0267 family)